MKTFETLKNNFSVNWTTILIGWEGLGMISLSPCDWEKSPPLLTLAEMYEHCYDALAKTDNKREISLIIDLLDLEGKPAERALIRSLLLPLANLRNEDTVFELRKWRVITLCEALEQLKGDVVDDLVHLSEFWMYFGFPPDSPMEFQSVGNNIRPEDFYTDENHKRVIVANKTWAQKELQKLKQTP